MQDRAEQILPVAVIDQFGIAEHRVLTDLRGVHLRVRIVAMIAIERLVAAVVHQPCGVIFSHTMPFMLHDSTYTSGV